jgi:hypothetical protein
MSEEGLWRQCAQHEMLAISLLPSSKVAALALPVACMATSVVEACKLSRRSQMQPAFSLLHEVPPQQHH